MQTDSLFGFGFFSNLKIAAPYSPRSNGKRRRRRRVNRKPPFPTSASYSSLPVKSPHEILRVPPVQRFGFSVWFRRSCVHSGAIVVLYRGNLLIAPCSTSCWNEGSRRSSLRFGEHTLRQRRLFLLVSSKWADTGILIVRVRRKERLEQMSKPCSSGVQTDPLVF